MAELQEVVRRLHNFREAGKELDGWFSEGSLQYTTAKEAKTPPPCTHRWEEGGQ